jgi:hypothetical protein
MISLYYTAKPAYFQPLNTGNIWKRLVRAAQRQN